MANYNDKTKLRTLLDDPRAVAVVEKYMGADALKSPLIAMAKDYTLGTAMKYYSLAGIPDGTANAMYREIIALEQLT